MNPKTTVPLIASAAPLIAAAPPLLLIVAIGGGLAWLLSRDKKKPEAKLAPDAPDAVPSVNRTEQRSARKIMLEDLARVFEDGGRSLTRTDAVAALQEMGFGKTAAYKALSPSGKFAAWFDYLPDGTIEWEG